MASFRLKFEDGLRKRGLEVTHNPDEASDAILVIGGTRHLLPLWRAKKRGLRIVQRLDGINWVQRVRWSGLRYSIRAEYGNALLAFIRNRLVDRVIYQSDFIRDWWKDRYRAARAPESVIINGVDLEAYAPVARDTIPPYPPYRLLVVEGSLAGGLDTGLTAAVRLAEILSGSVPIELAIAGRVDQRMQASLEKNSKIPVSFLGLISRVQIPELMRSSHLLFSAEINPPCPNSVIEALACGLPVVGFETGSLRELVGADAGQLSPYGANPWKLEPPNLQALAEAAKIVLNKQNEYRLAARSQAERFLNVDKMVESYLKVLLDDQD